MKPALNHKREEAAVWLDEQLSSSGMSHARPTSKAHRLRVESSDWTYVFLISGLLLLVVTLALLKSDHPNGWLNRPQTTQKP